MILLRCCLHLLGVSKIYVYFYCTDILANDPIQNIETSIYSHYFKKLRNTLVLYGTFKKLRYTPTIVTEVLTVSYKKRGYLLVF